MQSGKSFFNQTIFGKTVRRFWPLWLLYAGIWFFVLPMPLLGQLRWQLRPDAIECAGNVLTFAIMGGTIISFIFSAFTAMAVFSHLYNSKGTGMFCVLPVRREGMFFSCFLAGLLFAPGRLPAKRLPLCVFGGLATLVIYGLLLDAASVLMFSGAVTWAALLTSCASGFVFNVIHAAATVVFLALAGKPLLRKLDRIKTKYGILEA